MPAPERNTNAVGHKSPTKGKKGATSMMSLTHKEWEQFKAAAALSEGRALTDDECRKLWRDLDRRAVQAFIKENRDEPLSDH